MDFLLATGFSQLQFSVGTVNKYFKKLLVDAREVRKKNQ
jgi:hypothetical protein